MSFNLFVIILTFFFCYDIIVYKITIITLFFFQLVFNNYSPV